MSHSRLKESMKGRYFSGTGEKFFGVSNEELIRLLFRSGAAEDKDGRAEDKNGLAADNGGQAVENGDSQAAKAAGVSSKRSFPPVNSDVYSELLNRFSKKLLAKIGGVRHSGLDPSELMQECAIGLLRAALRYDPAKGASFETFFLKCIDNRLCDLIRRARSDKNNSLRSYDEIIENGADAEIPCLPDPESRFIIDDSVRELMDLMKQRLSDTEHGVFIRYLNGLSYERISAEMGIPVKAVDNALQRARKKLKALIAPDDDDNKRGGGGGKPSGRGKKSGTKKKDSGPRKGDPD